MFYVYQHSGMKTYIVLCLNLFYWISYEVRIIHLSCGLVSDKKCIDLWVLFGHEIFEKIILTRSNILRGLKLYKDTFMDPCGHFVT